MHKRVRVLKSTFEIKKRIRELGTEISCDYQDKDLILIGVLKGATMFLADLAREINLPLAIEFMRVSSYGHEAHSSGTIQIIADTTQSIEGKDVIIVEDIVDTGRTISALMEHLKAKKPASVTVCSLLYKPARNVVPVQIDYLGFEIPDVFVVGYGMDYQGKFRNLPFVGVLHEIHH